MDALTEPVRPGTTARRRPDGAWGVVWHPRPEARLRLLCLPHSGGGAAVYREWAALLPPRIEVVCVRLPGRESRFRERAFARTSELVPALVTGLERWLEGPYAWFGHSMGALVAYEACQEVRRRGLRAPERLLVSGRRAPHLPAREQPVHDAPADELLARLHELGGTPGELLGDPGVLAALLPMLRADFAVSETYPRPQAPPLDVPLSVFGATRDPVCDAAELHAWAGRTTAACTVRRYPGGHFFLHDDAREAVLRDLADDLRADGSPKGRAQ
ncbi:thioesterase II family protein [Streptomyces sp. NPDC053367]|uniref:thioesterase II family protein n=1 Tax=Streptomyces sp. NPDC053367 TaxID=3365700 RepID=UPI0037D4F7A8